MPFDSSPPLNRNVEVDAFCLRIRRRMSSRLRDEWRLTNKEPAARFSLRLEARQHIRRCQQTGMVHIGPAPHVVGKAGPRKK
jgi:hypothetical protein